MLDVRYFIPLLIALPLAALAQSAEPGEVELGEARDPWKDQPIDVPELIFPSGPALGDSEAIKREVGRALAAYEDSLHFCRDQTADEVAPAGSWRIAFTIRPGGQVDAVMVDDTQLPQGGTEACFRATVAAWVFPPLASPMRVDRAWTFAERAVPGVPLSTEQATPLIQDAIYDSSAAKRCFIEHKQAEGKLPGIATLSFTLQADGTPADVSMLERKLNKSELPGCLAEALSGLALPALQDGPVIYNFPFEF